MIDVNVPLSVEETGNIINDYLNKGSQSLTLVSTKTWNGPQGCSCTLAVYEKFFARNSGWASLTVCITDMEGETNVRAICSGSGSGFLLNLDYGITDSFEKAVIKALNDYIKY